MQGIIGSMLSNPDSLEQAVFEGDQSMTAYNMRMMQEGQWHVGLDGNMGQLIENMVDKKQGGKKRGPIYHYAGKEISKAEWDKRGFIPYEMGKTRAEIQGKIAAGQGKGVQPGTMQKDVNFIHRVMSRDGQLPFTRVDALNMWRGDKLMGKKLEVLNKWTETMGLSPSSNEAHLKQVQAKMAALTEMTDAQLYQWEENILDRLKTDAAAKKKRAVKKGLKDKQRAGAAGTAVAAAGTGLGKKKVKKIKISNKEASNKIYALMQANKGMDFATAKAKIMEKYE